MSQNKETVSEKDTAMENVTTMPKPRFPSIKLKKPLMVQGREYDELFYDIEGMTAEDCMNAEQLRMKKFGNMPTLVAAVDDPLHFCEFVVACCRAMPEMEEPDLCKMGRADYKEAAKLFAETFTD